MVIHYAAANGQQLCVCATTIALALCMTLWELELLNRSAKRPRARPQPHNPSAWVVPHCTSPPASTSQRVLSLCESVRVMHTVFFFQLLSSVFVELSLAKIWGKDMLGNQKPKRQNAFFLFKRTHGSVSQWLWMEVLVGNFFRTLGLNAGLDLSHTQNLLESTVF